MANCNGGTSPRIAAYGDVESLHPINHSFGNAFRAYRQKLYICIYIYILYIYINMVPPPSYLPFLGEGKEVFRGSGLN